MLVFNTCRADAVSSVLEVSLTSETQLPVLTSNISVDTSEDVTLNFRYRAV